MDPILTADDSRFVLFPIEYDDLWKMYKKQLDCFWRAEEVDLSKDLRDWQTLSLQEQTFISQILAFFASSDGIVCENLSARFLNDVQIAEARAFYSMQIFMENIHSEMYSLLIDTYISNATHKRDLLYAIQTYPSIHQKAEWSLQWITNNASFASRLVAFACVEGIFFSSSFCAIYWMKKRGLMPGLTLSNEFISRDEALHTEFAILLFHKLIHRPSDVIIRDIIQCATDCEKSFVKSILPDRLRGMNVALMTQYVEFVADRLCIQFGVDKLYGAKNPFDFMELISMDSKVNFFERTNSTYALSNKVIERDPFAFTMDF